MAVKIEALKAMGDLELKLDNIAFALDKLTEAEAEAKACLSVMSEMVDDIEEAEDD